MSLVAFVLIVYGITNILVNESIFRKQIDWLKTKNQFLNDVLSCSTCLSTYIGVVIFLVAPITLSGIFLLDILLAGLLSSGAINLIEQIKNRMFE